MKKKLCEEFYQKRKSRVVSKAISGRTVSKDKGKSLSER
jgi:hypothetical protein